MQPRQELPDLKGMSGSMGTAQLNGISAVPIAFPSITATSLIWIQILVPGGTIGLVWISSITPGVGFSVLSVALATSTICWLVIDPLAQ